VVCDTDFESGEERNLEEILDLVSECETEWIVWTGGEPTDQLTDEIISEVKKAGFKQAIECSGIKQPPEMDWIVLSPKIAEHAILKRWKKRDGFHCDELRWVRHNGQSIPNTQIRAKTYFISPHFDDYTPNDDNIRHCVKLALNHPKWRVSIQQHKLWKIL
tara:strand:- start:1668 stop:2150 length:483 start_codon:yes stop_codon:yes gene_type:complete